MPQGSLPGITNLINDDVVDIGQPLTRERLMECLEKLSAQGGKVKPSKEVRDAVNNWNAEDPESLKEFLASKNMCVECGQPDIVKYDMCGKCLNKSMGAAPIVKEKKIQRNDPCFCNSGKKFKKCHGYG